jgi:transposase
VGIEEAVVGRKRYSEELKQEAVRRYHAAGTSYEELARDLGVSGYSIRRWVLEALRLEADPNVASESEEVGRLRRENRSLREQCEILRKPAAFFAMGAHSNR